MKILIKRERNDVRIPEYRHAGDSGFDLYAAEEVVIAPGVARIVPTGISVALPEGYELQVRLRSSTGSR